MGGSFEPFDRQLFRILPTWEDDGYESLVHRFLFL
jgi:hypothetical protein